MGGPWIIKEFNFGELAYMKSTQLTNSHTDTGDTKRGYFDQSARILTHTKTQVMESAQVLHHGHSIVDRLKKLEN